MKTGEIVDSWILKKWRTGTVFELDIGKAIEEEIEKDNCSLMAPAAYTLYSVTLKQTKSARVLFS